MSVTGEIITIEETPDLQKNIIIWVQFKRDGVEIPQKHSRSGKAVWPLYCQMINFTGKTVLEQKAWVAVNIEHQIGNYIQSFARKIINTTLIDGILNDMIGDIYSKGSVVVDYDGHPATIYPDGSVT